MTAIIVDYNAGNLRSVQRACRHVGLDAEISADPDTVIRAERVIFPGVGSAVSAVDTLRERGLDEALRAFHASGRPLLGICLGSQIVLEHTEEGDKDCLGLIEGVVRKFDFSDNTLKVPHIGWNEVEIVQSHPLFKRIRDKDELYFVHSYHACPVNEADIYGMTEYGVRFCSAIGKNNLFATQFHMEKSGEIGLSILAEFGEWNPC
ncbi:MAG: imidazole glycerol phosphate synthase subunit HisH [Pseudomonadales bacterium]|nr:imidazole glycerol phosphate synthase subunit HisH [Pseudomonadales bacterium]